MITRRHLTDGAVTAVSTDDFRLYDDASVREKLTVCTKTEALFDDSRNDDEAFWEAVDELLELGGRYRITVERVGDADEG